MAILKFKRLRKVKYPEQGTIGSAGLDVFMPEDYIVPAGAMGHIVPLGISLEVPNGFHVELLPRSSTGTKTPIRMANSVGIIDSDYRGEIGAIVDNISGKDFMLQQGNKYFQLVVKRNHLDGVNEVTALSHTERGTGGYGSTGK